MATVTELEDRKETLEEAIDSGELNVKYADRSVTYRDQASMERALQRLCRRIDKLNGKKAQRKVRIQSCSGW